MDIGQMVREETAIVRERDKDGLILGSSGKDIEKYPLSQSRFLRKLSYKRLKKKSYKRLADRLQNMPFLAENTMMEVLAECESQMRCKVNPWIRAGPSEVNVVCHLDASSEIKDVFPWLLGVLRKPSASSLLLGWPWL